MNPLIKEGTLVTLRYRETLDDGTVVDDSFEGTPRTFVQGAESVVPGLERALMGKGAGEEFSLTLGPEEGYGAHKADAERIVARTNLPAEVAPEPGMVFGLEGAGEITPFWVLEVDEQNVVLTDNHPLAGERLLFDVKILDVKEPTEEESASPDT